MRSELRFTSRPISEPTASRPRLQGLHDFIVFGKSSRFMFGIDEVTVSHHVKYSLLAHDQLGGDRQFFGQCGCQTGSLGLVVSLTAIGDRNTHVLNLSGLLLF